MILVVGATGLLGMRICQRLRDEGKRVRALVRTTSDPQKTNQLQSSGCELVVGDLKRRAEVEAACRGVSAVISTASSTLSRQPGDSIETVDLHGQLTLVNAAKAAGVQRFVYVSFRNNPAIQYPLAEAKRAVEEAIADLDFTSIQASWFMELWLSPALGFDYMNCKVRIYGDGSKPISWVSYYDVAEFCIAPVIRNVASRAVLQVGGPEPFNPSQVVEIFEQESGRQFEIELVPESRVREQFDSSSDSLQKSFAGLMLQYSQGDPMDMADLLRVIPVRLTSVREYAKSVLARAKAASATLSGEVT